MHYLAWKIDELLPENGMEAFVYSLILGGLTPLLSSNPAAAIVFTPLIYVVIMPKWYEPHWIEMSIMAICTVLLAVLWSVII